MRMVKRRAEQRFHADLTGLVEPRRMSGRDLLGRRPSWALRAVGRAAQEQRAPGKHFPAPAPPVLWRYLEPRVFRHIPLGSPPSLKANVERGQTPAGPVPMSPFLAPTWQPALGSTRPDCRRPRWHGRV